MEHGADALKGGTAIQNSYRDRGDMKLSIEAEVNGKFHQVKGKPTEALGKVMNEPTLEGKDENKVGRVQRKTAGKRSRKMTVPAGPTRDQCMAV